MFAGEKAVETCPDTSLLEECVDICTDTATAPAFVLQTVVPAIPLASQDAVLHCQESTQHLHKRTAYVENAWLVVRVVRKRT